MYYVTDKHLHLLRARRRMEDAMHDASILAVQRDDVFRVLRDDKKELAVVGPLRKLPKLRPEWGKVGLGDVEGPEAIRVAS